MSPHSFPKSLAVVLGFGLLAGSAEARAVRTTTRTHVNSNVNRDVDVHRDIDVDVDRNYHPVATAAAVTATATVTAAAIGSVARSLPPACSTAVVSGVTYQNCEGTWYQPRYSGTEVSYVVVNPPR
ncbi:hypothetical protein HUA76_39555 [Myxococcus sp. CA056]|uniref:hypothetical protein n=1 Tax=Myxococcus sp. CA056 TaxID=2741740 RepID=UPI00157B84BE|nr:hypothetical protein [Myxococcus sp. CA056]NTX16888.1 hypothetical protein [Myxococcus sp. CA056]